MFDSPDEAKQRIKAARSCGHRLAGMLSSISIGLHCIRVDKPSEPVLCCVGDMEKCLLEANEELDRLRAIIRWLDGEEASQA